jgi:5-formyltetrahydrofolate cyclo-ligase
MAETKAILRTQVSHLRDSLPRSDVVHKSGLIQARALAFLPYRQCSAVALYSSIANEVATDDVRDHALKSGKKIFYPKFGAGRDLHLARLKDRDDLKPGRYGILEPSTNEFLTRVGAERLVVFVPGLAFDLFGNRLGRGQGGYDRLLAALHESVMTVGLAYELQIVDEIPTDTWDRKVRHILTERRVIDWRDIPSHTWWVG